VKIGNVIEVAGTTAVENDEIAGKNDALPENQIHKTQKIPKLDYQNSLKEKCLNLVFCNMRVQNRV